MVYSSRAVLAYKGRYRRCAPVTLHIPDHGTAGVRTGKHMDSGEGRPPGAVFVTPGRWTAGAPVLRQLRDGEAAGGEDPLEGLADLVVGRGCAGSEAERD